MKTDTANLKANFYFNKVKKWQNEVEQLRHIALNCELNEEVKWGKPCYVVEGHNIVLIHDFKDYCALLFFKGALMKDPNNILVQQTEHVQAARQLRFANLADLKQQEPVIKAYIKEAIEIDKAGLKVELKKTTNFTVPEEFQKTLNDTPMLKTAFAALTPGRQKGYLLYFAAPKQTKTRNSRIEKCVSKILSGKGLDD